MLEFLRLAPVPDSGEHTTATATTSQIRIVLADDHAAMRRNLRALLDGEADLQVVAETDTLSSVVAHVRTRRPDVLVLDLGLSADGSFEMLRQLRAQLRSTHIVVLSSNDDPAFAQGALDAGAFGLVLKEMADSDLPAAVRAAWSDERYVSPTVAVRLKSERTLQSKDRLTPREREVLRLIALGHTSVEIAATLGLSPRTIETHRARIHRKLGLATRAELVRYALRHSMLRL